MSWKKALAAAVLAGVVSYIAVSVYVVSASLRTTGACASSDSPPPGFKAESISFRSRADDTPLVGWLLPSGSGRAVILLHGIDADAWMGAEPDLAAAYADAGFSVLLFDLRAHGRSGGQRITLGSLERGDVRAAVDLLLRRGFSSGRIGLHGTSYGAAMAVLAAAEIPEVGAVVADSAFADVRDLMAAEVEQRAHVPGDLAASLLRPGIETAARLFFGIDLAGVEPVNAVQHIAPRPLLIIHGGRDPVIPVEQARQLAEHAGSDAELWILDGMGHAQGIRSGPCYRVPSPGRAAFLRRVVSFMGSAIAPR